MITVAGFQLLSDYKGRWCQGVELVKWI